jgi:hypothetical protein
MTAPSGAMQRHRAPLRPQYYAVHALCFVAQQASKKGKSYSAYDFIHTMPSRLVLVIASNFQELKDLFHS